MHSLQHPQQHSVNTHRYIFVHSSKTKPHDDVTPDVIDARVFVCDAIELHEEAHAPQVVRLVVVLRARPQQNTLENENQNYPHVNADALQAHCSGSTHLDRVHERVEAVLEELNAESAQECSDTERRASRCVSVAVAQCNAIARDATLLLAVVERHVAHLQHARTCSD